jgi:uncharacterized NAD(P)/FAD-binding protein YdhS
VGLGDAGTARVIAIVGAGFSGTMAAIHLRHTLPADVLVYLLDKTGRFARGPAYADSAKPHLLNVRALNMSALPDDPGHFHRWMTTQIATQPGEVSETDAGRFATRRLYGRYLRALLYQEISLSGGQVRLSGEDITGMTPTTSGWRLHGARGRQIDVAGVVLAVGTLPSSRGREGVVHFDPWTPEAISNLRPDEPVLVVGTGLTMVDLTLGLRDEGFNGPIIAVSRRGLLPQSHMPPSGAWSVQDITSVELQSLTPLLRRIRAEIREAAHQGIDWRAVIDSLRPVTSLLWRGLAPSERARFLRHLRPFWEIHRHRMAPSVAERFNALRRDGGLLVRRGRVKSITSDDTAADVCLQDPQSGLETLRVQRVIYATGLGSAGVDGGLLAQLRGQGLVRTDRLGMGLDVTDRLEVIGEDGTVTPRLWALGPILRGVFWECTAVPDIRVQARALATEVSKEAVLF